MNNIGYKLNIPKYLVSSKIFDVVATDLKGDYIYVNDTFKKRFSFISDDFIGKPSSISIHPDDVKKAESVVLKCFKYPDQAIKVQLRKPIKDKSYYYWTQWEFSLLKNNENLPIGILCIGYDITDKKQNLNDLIDTKFKLSKVIETIPHPLVLITDEDKIKYVNKEFESVFEYSSIEIVGKNLSSIFSDDNYDTCKNILENFKDGSSKKVQVEQYLDCKTKSGKYLSIGASLGSYKLRTKTSIVLILQDLTISKKHQDAIINQNIALKAIAWRHSHEIRKPVTNLLGLISLIEEGIDTSQSNKKSIHFIKQSVEELDQLTREIVRDANKNDYKVRFEKYKRL